MTEDRLFPPNLSASEKALVGSMDQYREMYTPGDTRTLEKKWEEDKAITDYKESIDINPDNFTANYNVGIIYYNKGKLLILFWVKIFWNL